MSKLEGARDGAFADLQDALESNLASGKELGVAAYIDIDGTPAFDMWGGYRDREQSARWEADTIVNVWSTSKAVTSLAVLMLIDRGQLSLTARVSDYWPEFAQNGKQDIQVRHLLSHTSGVSGWDQPFGPTDMYNHSRAAARLAQQEPWWPPGTASGYHANNFGHLNGELVRRVTGKSLGRFIAEEIAEPLGADYYLGVPDDEVHRIATIYGPQVTTLPEPPRNSPEFDTSVQRRTLEACVTDPKMGNDPDFRRAEIGATNGHGTARGIAQILASMSRPGTIGTLLSPATAELVFQEQSNGIDLVLGIPLRWGIGYALESPGVPYVHGTRTCFWGGWGGSMVVMDRERKLTFCYVMNQMHPGTIGSELSREYCEIVNSITKQLT